MYSIKKMVYACSSRITLPVIMISPVLFFFTLFCILDETFLSSDVQAVVLLWALVGISLLYFFCMRRDIETNQNVMFGIGTTQLIVLTAACMSIFAVVQEDSNTPRTQLSASQAEEMNRMIMRGLR
jgi:hypothetical protein